MEGGKFMSKKKVKILSILLTLVLLFTFFIVITTTNSSAISEWRSGVGYNTGDFVTYQGKVYKCLYGHTAMVGWEPPNVPQLWLYMPTLSTPIPD